ncbi:hypothetical protein [Sinomonas susongensis]|uniref:hypothetical protein n=1 Tax=Sinomonas susongensis TaxID=1324851 RepID=UPI003CCC78FF
MNPSFSLGTFADFVQERWPDILSLTGQHLAVLVISLLIATALGVLVGVAVWNRPLPRTAALTTAGIAITVPSLALLALLSPLLGLGWGPRS